MNLPNSFAAFSATFSTLIIAFLLFRPISHSPSRVSVDLSERKGEERRGEESGRKGKERRGGWKKIAGEGVDMGDEKGEKG